MISAERVADGQRRDSLGHPTTKPSEATQATTGQNLGRTPARFAAVDQPVQVPDSGRLACHIVWTGCDTGEQGANTRAKAERVAIHVWSLTCINPLRFIE